MKQTLRKLKLLQRKKQHPSKKKSKDQAIVQKLERSSIFKKSKKIGLYLPIHGEVDLTPLVEKYGKKKIFVLPRVKGKTLRLHAIEHIGQTAKGSYNILEPHHHLPLIKAKDLDLILIPGVVFSQDGHRIGYGKGFYDRLLKKTTCVKIGIAYEFQIVKNIPGESHDVPMDMIITEKNTLKVVRKKHGAAGGACGFPPYGRDSDHRAEGAATAGAKIDARG